MRSTHGLSAALALALASCGGDDGGPPIDAPVNAAPAIVTEPGPEATEDTPFVYRPIATDPDGPVRRWSFRTRCTSPVFRGTLADGSLTA